MIVKRVKVENKLVTIYLDDKSSFKISLNTYLDNKILKDEEIDKETIAAIRASSDIDLVREDLIKKLSRKRLSSKECKDFLLERNVSLNDASTIIKELENSHIINDEDLASEIILYCLAIKKGRQVMKNKLISRQVKGDYDKYLNKYLDEEKYIQNIDYLINKYSKLGKNKSNLILKKYVLSKVEENGYSKQELEGHVVSVNNDENTIIRKEIDKFFLVHDKNKENIMKITRKLLSKGFNYDIIKRAIGECDSSEID